MLIRSNLKRSSIAGGVLLLWAVMLAGLTHPAAYASPQSSGSYTASSRHYAPPAQANRNTGYAARQTSPPSPYYNSYRHHKSHRTAKYTVGGAAGGALIGGLAGGGKGVLLGGALGAGG